MSDNKLFWDEGLHPVANPCSIQTTLIKFRWKIIKRSHPRENKDSSQGRSIANGGTGRGPRQEIAMRRLDMPCDSARNVEQWHTSHVCG